MSAAEWEKVILDAVRSVVRPLGFKKKGRRFIRVIDNMEQMVELQRSRSSNQEALSFTLNLGVRYKPLKLGFTDFIGLDSSTCHWVQRIGNLLPISEDFWWQVANESEAAKVAQEVADAVAGFVIAYSSQSEQRSEGN
jgi:hypothetical protein